MRAKGCGGVQEFIVRDGVHWTWINDLPSWWTRQWSVTFLTKYYSVSVNNDTFISFLVYSNVFSYLLQYCKTLASPDEMSWRMLVLTKQNLPCWFIQKHLLMRTLPHKRYSYFKNLLVVTAAVYPIRICVTSWSDLRCARRWAKMFGEMGNCQTVFFITSHLAQVQVRLESWFNQPDESDE